MNYSRTIPMNVDRRLPQVQTRRVALNLAMRVLTTGFVAGLLLCTGNRVDAHPVNQVDLITSIVVTGQQQGSLVEQRKQQEMLQAARDAMRQGDLSKAEVLIRQAQRFNVPIDPAYGKYRDNPEKALRDLNELKAVQSNPDYLGQKLTGQLPSDKSAMAAEALKQGRTALAQGQLQKAATYLEAVQKIDPKFATPQDSVAALHRDLMQVGVQPSTLGGNSQATPGLARLPEVGSQPTPQTQANPYASGSSLVKGDSQTARRMLLEARMELASGNVAVSESKVRQVKSMGLVFPAHQDSPENVEFLIRKIREITTAPAGPQTGYQYGELMLRQAEGLMLYGQYDIAERMTRQVQSMNLKFDNSRVTPDRLMAEIVRRRSGDAGGAPTAKVAGSNTRDQEQAILVQAKAAMDRGDMVTAHAFAKQAASLGNQNYQPSDLRPDLLMMEIARNGGFVQQAQATDTGAAGFPVAQGIYRPESDGTKTMPASATGPTGQAGSRYLADGEQALRAGDKVRARQMFEEAWKFQSQLDPASRQRLQDYLKHQTNPVTSGVQQTAAETPLNQIDARQQVLLRQMIAEVTREQSQADAMREVDPKGSLQKLQKVRSQVDESAIDSVAKRQLLARVDRSIESLESYIDINRAQIELDERNQTIKDEISKKRELTVEVEERLAEMVEQFNDLMEQQRWQEAEVIARQAREIAPDNPVVETLIWKAKFARRTFNNLAIRDAKEEGFVTAMMNADLSAVPFDDNNPYQFGNAQEWADMTATRRKWLEQNTQLSEDEVEIRKALKTKVDVNFERQSLQTVMETLGNYAGINVQLDPRGLQAEGVTYDTEITINMQQAVRLESALNHILQPLGLSYVIRDEALVITSESFRSRNTYTKTYNVADLVLPIPNFTPGQNSGLAGAIKAGYELIGYGGAAAPNRSVSPISYFANNASLENSEVLGQIPNGLFPGGGSGQIQTGQPMPGGGFGFGQGAGGFGGGIQPNFDELMELITTTVVPESWEELGGPGSIAPFSTNLSLVISQTQEVHDKLADLLEQLRRLQDLQVTIEVRFITLNDNFFERIGVDFAFDIQDNTAPDVVGANSTRDISGSPSVTVGLDQGGELTPDLDLSFTQASFNNTLPTIGGLAGTAGAQFGFAMLSDIEAFFVMNAAQGDLRTNVMQAPKVTLFNGQQASVTDTTDVPFVTSVTPVVGDFAAAQQPVITVLSEGTQLSVQAVVSPDRRFVRLTLVPLFSRIGEVQEFTFEGSTTTRDDSTVADPDAADGGTTTDNNEAVTSGTTIQQPQFSTVSVNTTVSVPDGGTVLLGGIKRLSEERRERGVPVMSKLPYINRLFKNVGIGRETSSLMMMVTPRIIIQEEEETKLGLTP